MLQHGIKKIHKSWINNSKTTPCAAGGGHTLVTFYYDLLTAFN